MGLKQHNMFEDEPRKPKSKVFEDGYKLTDKVRDQEERVASKVGGHRQPGSGAFMGSKGDVKAEEFLMECKRTGGNALAIRQDWLEKIDKEATAQRKIPALTIEFDRMPVGVDRDWVLTPMSAFKEMLAAWRAAGGGKS